MAAPAQHLSTWTMTREALTVEFDAGAGFLGRARGQDITRFRCGGRRVCIGQSFALMEMVLITSMMSQTFVFDLAPGTPVELEATLTLRPKHGVAVIGRKRATP